MIDPPPKPSIVFPLPSFSLAFFNKPGPVNSYFSTFWSVIYIYNVCMWGLAIYICSKLNYIYVVNIWYIFIYIASYYNI